MDLVSIFLEDLGKQPTPSKEKERELIFASQQGDIEARNYLIVVNLPYVIKLASRYLGWSRAGLVDLINEGALAFIDAIYKYKLSGDASLTTYATYWIRKQMLNYALSSRSILSISGSTRSNFQAAQKFLRMVLEREPTLHELSDYTGLKRATIIANLKAEQDISIYELGYDEGYFTRILGCCDDFETMIEAEQLFNLALKAIRSDRDRKIFRLYYGLDREPLNASEIGYLPEFCVTREYIRQRLKIMYAQIRKRIEQEDLYFE